MGQKGVKEGGRSTKKWRQFWDNLRGCWKGVGIRKVGSNVKNEKWQNLRKF